MKRKHWDYVTLISVVLMAAGFALYHSGFFLGRVLLAVGLIAFLASVIGVSVFQRKHPSRCPICGEPLRFVGRTFWGIGFLGAACCPSCGAVVSPKDL